MDVPGRKGVECGPEEVPFPEERVDSFVFVPKAATPWSRRLPAVREARRRRMTFLLAYEGRVLLVPEPRGDGEEVRLEVVLLRVVYRLLALGAAGISF